MNHITAGCRCGHRSAGDPTTVVKEMQAHFLRPTIERSPQRQSWPRANH